MKEGWTYKKLGDECSILYGYPFDSKCFSTSPDDMPLIRIRDVKEGKTSTFYNGDYPKDYIIHKGDYLIGMDGEFNISPWQSEDALLNQRVCKISCNTSSLLIRYVYRFLIKELKKIEDETPFVTVKHLSAKKINQINIPVPPLGEQERIVAELDLLSGIIEKKKEQLKAYDQLAQSIFYTMFGDPIDNPKGWEVKKLDELCTVITKGTTPTTLGFPFVEEGINFVKVESFIDGRIDSSKLSHITHECNLALSRSKLEDKDLLVCIAGATIGKMAVVDSSILPANTNQACAIIRLKDKRAIRYIQLFLELKFENDVMQMGKGVAQPNLSLGQLRNLFLPMPPIGQRETFTTTLEAIERQKALVQQSIDETQTMFDYTMDKYFG